MRITTLLHYYYYYIYIVVRNIYHNNIEFNFYMTFTFDLYMVFNFKILCNTILQVWYWLKFYVVLFPSPVGKVRNNNTKI